MTLKDTQNKLSSDISALYETYRLISKDKRQVNDLDVALLQQQLLYIYNSLLRIQGQLGRLQPGEDTLTPINSSENLVDEESVQPDLFNAQSLAENTIEETVPKQHAKEDSEQRVAEKEAVKQLMVEPEPTLDELEVLMKQEEERETEQVKQADLVTEPVKVNTSEPSLSLLDKLTANARTPEVHEKITQEQLSLKQVINLNKKIAFVNNLFNENTVEYAKAIERLNSASGLHEALRYFSELKHQYNWNNENNLVKDLEELIEKRYS